jgi:hypothetical protein
MNYPTDLFHLLWGLVAALSIYVYKKDSKGLTKVQHKVSKQGKKLAKHSQFNKGVEASLDEIKATLAKLYDLIEKKNSK